MKENENAAPLGRPSSSPIEGRHSGASAPLAIVGIGCLFPQAEGLQTYWSNIKERVDAITEVPSSHWQLKDYFDADPKSPDRTYGRRGGFLKPVDFDPTEFGISPNNIAATDPAQLLGLVVAQAAMRDAGYGPEKEFDRRRVSVILGVTGTLELTVPLGARLGHPVWRKALKEAGIEGPTAEAVVKRIADHYVEWQENSFPGLLGNVVAGRIANRLDLGGTNCVVDAACASSLSAGHLASLELAAGRSDMVVTGGVDTFNDIFMYMCFSKTPALSPTGDSKPFDGRGDGTILGEGIGMVVLKRLADAERDGDRIYAVLKAIGSSSDGRGKAIYAPSPEGQVKALKEAYRLAGVTPDTISLVEAHGTGTKVGDAAEVRALSEVYREARKDGTWCALGSVKSQIGHTKAAAGSAGLIKAALALHNKVLPPTMKVQEPLPELASGETPFYVNTEKRPWLPEEGRPRRAGVSAFGFGGSNFHAVLEEHKTAKAEPDWDGKVELAAFSEDSLDALRSSVAAWSKPGSWDELRLKAAESRKTFSRVKDFRLVAVLDKDVTDAPKLFTALAARLEADKTKTSWSTPEGAFFASGPVRGKLGLLFPGQGSQYVGMGRDLACQFPELLDVLAEADAAFRKDAPARLSDFIYPHPVFNDAARAKNETALRATEVAQPAIGAVSLGALRLLSRFALKPEAAAGHSYGELAALCAAGVLSSSDLHRLSRLRGRLMAAGGGDKGGMLAVLAPLEAIQALLSEEKLDLVLANKNAPQQSVLSGSTEAIRRAAAACDKRGLKNTILPVAAAFHSPLVADAKVPFRAALKDAAFGAPSFPVYANTTAAVYPDSADASRDLLAGQLASPVEFTAEIQAMHKDGVRTFIEVGPGARLTGLVKAILGDAAHDALALDASAGRRHGVLDLGRFLAQLAASGHALDLVPWQGGEAAMRELARRKKPKISVPVSGATPLNPKSAVPMTRPPQSAPPVHAPATPSVAMTAPSPAPLSSGPVRPAIQAAALSGGLLSEALRSSQEGLAALQRLQEQTSSLHRQYLEGQEATQKTLLGLIERQQGLFAQAAGMGGAAVIPAIAPPQSVAASPALVIEQPRVAAVPASPGADKVSSTLLSVVSEKTGYPVETLNLDMGLESDLGIDSIKRVEILSAMREKLPQAPVVGPQHLGTLRTLRQIIDFLSQGASGGAAPYAPPPQSSPATGGGSSLDPAQVQAALLSVVSEKTGYPIETLNLDMGLESDLGIDSIKRVEILSAMRERLPQAPVVGPQHLGTLRTLRQIIDFLSQGASGGTAPYAPPPQSSPATGGGNSLAPAQVQAALLNVVSEKTGYPVETLNLDMGLESDLGIDSIKRVEILSAMRERLPQAPTVGPSTWEHSGRSGRSSSSCRRGRPLRHPPP